MTKFVQMVHETKENLLWLLQGFSKGDGFFFKSVTNIWAQIKIHLSTFKKYTYIRE